MTTYSVTYYTLSGRQLADFDRNVTLDYVARHRADEYARAEPPMGPVIWMLAGRQVTPPAFAGAPTPSSASMAAQVVAEQQRLQREAMGR